MLSKLSDLAEVKEFRILTGDALSRWLARRVREMELNFTPSAERQLIDLVGGDLVGDAGRVGETSSVCRR